VIGNGPRKSGTNAIRSIVIGLGFVERYGGIKDNTYEWRHKSIRMPFSQFEPTLKDNEVIGAHSPNLKTKHVQLRIVRDPRDMVISYYRWRRKRNRSTNSIPQFRNWIKTNADGFANVTRPFLPWYDDPEVFHYETLFEEKTVRKIADRCGVPYKCVADRYGVSATWSGQPSDWKEWFDADGLKIYEDRLGI